MFHENIDKGELLEKMHGESEAHRRVRKLLEDPEWGHFFQFSCECGPDRLTSQTWQWQEELRGRGHKVSKTAVEDALLELAHELLPDSPAGDDPRGYLFNRAARWVGARAFETTPAEDAELNEAFYGATSTPKGRYTLSEYREALRAWCKVGSERAEKGAA